jgi:outer membrane protein assembly factor BamB
VFAFDVGTGDVAWSESIGRPVDVAPAVTGGAIVVAGQGTAASPTASIVALDTADGSVQWRREVEAVGAVLPSAPSMAGGLVVASFTDFSVRAWDIDTGEPRWTASVGYPPSVRPIPLDSGVAIDGDAVFVGDQIGSVYRLDARSGERVWDFAINESITFGAPVVSGGSVLIGTDEGLIHALDPDTGERISRAGGGGEIRSITPSGSVVVTARAGAGAGLDAYARDPAGRLSREASPTTPDLPRILGWFALAALPLAGVGVAAGRLIGDRMGAAFESRVGFESPGEEEGPEG